jgi:hypothetical protein
MKTIPAAVLRPLFLLSFLLIFLFSCKKDDILPEKVNHNPEAGLSKYHISVEEALAYYSAAKSVATSSAVGDAVRPFIQIDPAWDLAYSSLTPGGNEVVVVPLADSSIRVNNQGRADAKLVFRKISQDSITAKIMLYAADSAYYVSQGNMLNFNNFTGAFVLFDLGFHFESGVVMEAGSPVNSVDTVNVVKRLEVVDRENVECDEVIDIFVYTTCYQAFTNNYCEDEADTYIWWDCHPGGGGSGGGGGGNSGGGSGGSGGGSSGGSGGGSTNPPTGPTYWDVFSGEIPVGAFTGALPPGFDLQLFQQLVDIINAHHFSVDQVKWLMSHTDLIPIIWNASGPNQTGEEFSMVVPVLNFVIENNLDGDQYQYLIYHSSVFQTLNNFLLQHPNSPEARSFVLQALDAQMLLSQMPNQPLLSLSDLIRIYENFGSIKEALLPPNNTAVSVGDPICLATMNFSILHNPVANQDYAAMVLQNIFIQFNVPNTTPLTVHLDNLRMESYAVNDNNTCLASSGVHAVNAINFTVAQIQQMIDSPPPNSNRTRILNAIKFIFEQRMDNRFRQEVQWCNPFYTSNVSLRQENSDQANEVNCDDAMINCP